MARPAPNDDGSPARLIAAMVGIVGILLLGSLTWSAVGALFSAVGEAAGAFSTGRSPITRLPTPAVVTVGTPTPAAVANPNPTEMPAPTSVPVAPTPEATPAAATPRPTAAASGRAPWILLPQPAPGSQVEAGAVVVEARGRGEVPISIIRLELDGAPLPVSLEQRSESTWRGFANTRVAAGTHAVRATVVDEQGRAGSYRWTFSAGP